jgi:hypothetical protein
MAIESAFLLESEKRFLAGATESGVLAGEGDGFLLQENEDRARPRKAFL